MLLLLLRQPGVIVSMGDQPSKIIVELVSSADVKRLEARDDELRQIIDQQSQRIDGLHRTIYELMDLISKLRSKR